MTTAETWGHIYAIIDRVSAGGLTANQINKAAYTPGTLFGWHYRQIHRRLPKWADERLEELINNISPDDSGKQLGLEEQGQFFLGLYHEKARLEAEQAQTAAAGRPAKNSAQAVDWSDVDWAKSDTQIAQEKGVARQTANAQRKRHSSKQDDCQ
jgi:hypothetical protein